MPELLAPTKISLSGPWLIDSAALSELDQLLSDELNRLERYRSELLQAQVEDEFKKDTLAESYRSKLLIMKEGIVKGEGMAGKLLDEIEKRRQEIYSLNDHYLPKDKSIRIYFSSGKALAVDAITEAMRQTEVIDEIPTSLRISINYGKISCRIDLSRSLRDFDIDVSPSSSQVANEMFASIRRWAMRHIAPLWQRIWVRITPVQWPIWIIAVVTSLSIIDSTAKTTG